VSEQGTKLGYGNVEIM